MTEKPYLGARVIYRGKNDVRVRTPVSNFARDAAKFHQFYSAVEEAAKKMSLHFKKSLELRVILDE